MQTELQLRNLTKFEDYQEAEGEDFENEQGYIISKEVDIHEYKLAQPIEEQEIKDIVDYFGFTNLDICDKVNRLVNSYCDLQEANNQLWTRNWEIAKELQKTKKEAIFNKENLLKHLGGCNSLEKKRELRYYKSLVEKYKKKFEKSRSILNKAAISCNIDCSSTSNNDEAEESKSDLSDSISPFNKTQEHQDKENVPLRVNQFSRSRSQKPSFSSQFYKSRSIPFKAKNVRDGCQDCEKTKATTSHLIETILGRIETLKQESIVDDIDD
ncbi:unnamed protein product [Moneuplotes crassus]|uniref:Uncharacterized protein n=1 Tax=Euplotes crassus TaxID=5936 RepID=A0AAD1XPU5_EUPCR|nr:unnamed protein product [Moneuplotes crassus]